MRFRLRLVGLASVLTAVTGAGAARADVAAPNATGVSMGHLHFFVDDVAANRDFWIRLGGTPESSVLGDVVVMPGVLVAISERPADSPAAVTTSVVDHVAFRVASLAAIAARGLVLEPAAGFPGIASAMAPNGIRVELFEEGTATNVGFEPEFQDEVAERHNRPLVGVIDSHHLHMYLPEEQVQSARDWYVAHFGAVPGMRWRYTAADVPGMNLNFSAAEDTRAPTRGHTLDHIGFEVANLESFCRALADEGIAFDVPFSRPDPAFAFAVLTDPSGVTLELTEGLAGL